MLDLRGQALQARPMNAVLLITISGKDRPGLVRDLARIAADSGANWENSRMMHLAGRFIGLLEIHVHEAKETELVSSLRDLEGLEMTVARGETPGSSGRIFQLSVLGADHPGIVSEIAEVVVEYGLNIETLTTGTETAAGSGTPLFRAHLRLGSSGSIQLGACQEALESLAQDLMVDIKIEEE